MADTMLDIVRRGKGLTFKFKIDSEGFDAFKKAIENMGDRFQRGLDVLIFETKSELSSLRIAGIKNVGEEPNPEDWITLPASSEPVLTQTETISGTLWEHEGKLTAWVEGNKRRGSFHVVDLNPETPEEKKQVKEFLEELNARNEKQGLKNPFLRICPECGKKFTPIRQEQRFDKEQCAARARAREYRRRKREERHAMPGQLLTPP